VKTFIDVYKNKKTSSQKSIQISEPTLDYTQSEEFEKEFKDIDKELNEVKKKLDEMRNN